MTAIPTLSKAEFELLRKLDTCSVSNAIERFNLRLRNEGFISGAVRCHFPQFQPMLGYAVTARIQASSTPIAGGHYHDNMDWWNHVDSVPEPRVMVMEDIDGVPGRGAMVGEVHAAIAQAFHCVGNVTNGAVRDLAAVESRKFHLFSASVVVSHAYAHMVEIGAPVKIDGLTIAPGDLVHGDRNGVHTIPLSIASELPKLVAEIANDEQALIEFCRSPLFSLKELSQRLQRISENGASRINPIRGRAS